MTTPVLEPRGESPPAQPAVPDRPSRTGPRVLVAALALIVVQLLVRGWTVAERGLYGDDLVFASRAAQESLWASSTHLHDGHFMPLALGMAGVLSRLAPLEWWPEATALLVLQALASLAVLRMLVVLLGRRPLVLAALLVYLWSPLSLGSFAWWAPAINYLPLQAGLAWVVTDTVLLVRTGRRRYAWSGIVVFALTLASYERALLVPALSLAVAAVVLRGDGVPRAWWAALRRGALLWGGCTVVVAGWGAVYLSKRSSAPPLAPVTPEQVLAMVGRMYEAVLPAFLGGPWRWAPVPPGTPFALPPAGTSLLAGVALAGVVLWTSWRRRGGAVVWATVAVYLGAGAVPVAVGRAGTDLADVLPLTYRYFGAEAVLMALVVALLVTLPDRLGAPDGDGPEGDAPDAAPPSSRAPGTLVLPLRLPALVPVLTAVFVVSSVVSTVTYTRAWAGEPTRDYLAAARASLAAAGSSPLLDQAVPEVVLWSASHPSNLASQVFAPLTDRPPFGSWTDELRVLDDRGLLRPAHVAGGVHVAQAPAAASSGCRAQVGARGVVPLDAALFGWEWTVQLDYVADRDGELSMSMGGGEAVPVRVQEGPGTVYVRLVGEGAGLELVSGTPGLELCVRSGVVGNTELD